MEACRVVQCTHKRLRGYHSGIGRVSYGITADAAAAAAVHGQLGRSQAIGARSSSDGSSGGGGGFLRLPLVLLFETSLCDGEEEGALETVLPAMGANKTAIAVVERAEGRTAVVNDVAANLLATARVASSCSLDAFS